jgi:ATP phosphoribosyltransferase
LEVIAESSARLMVNRASYQTKREEIVQMVETLEGLV